MDIWNLHKTGWFACLVCMLAALCLGGDGYAHADREFQRHGENLKYWFDATGQRDFSTVQNEDFQPIPKSSRGFGFTRGALWVRLDLAPHENSDLETHWLEFDSALLSYWQVYVPGRDQPIYEAGLSLPRAAGDRFRSPAYRVELASGKAGTWFFRLRSDHALTLNPELHTEKSLNEKEKSESFFLGAYAGVMIFTYILTLYIFLRTRHRNFLYYSLLLLSFHLIYQFTYNQMAALYI